MSVQGTGPFTCQWLFNGSSLASGAGLTNIAVTASPANLGYYCVVIANSNGSVMSSLAALAVISPPVITIQPVSQSAAAGATVCFNISATGTAPLAYQWFDGAAALPGATNEMLTLSDISEANAGNYNVVISNSAGSVTSSLVTLSILNPPVITSQPVPRTVPLARSPSLMLVCRARDRLLTNGCITAQPCLLEDITTFWLWRAPPIWAITVSRSPTAAAA